MEESKSYSKIILEFKILKIFEPKAPLKVETLTDEAQMGADGGDWQALRHGHKGNRPINFKNALDPPPIPS